jgi:hypothetical protein
LTSRTWIPARETSGFRSSLPAHEKKIDEAPSATAQANGKHNADPIRLFVKCLIASLLEGKC